MLDLDVHFRVVEHSDQRSQQWKPCKPSVKMGRTNDQSKTFSRACYSEWGEIQNFRGISSLSVEFQIAESMCSSVRIEPAKTAVLDALRLCLGYALERRDIYIQSEDFFIDAESIPGIGNRFSTNLCGTELFFSKGYS